MHHCELALGRHQLLFAQHHLSHVIVPKQLSTQVDNQRAICAELTFLVKTSSLHREVSAWTAAVSFKNKNGLFFIDLTDVRLSTWLRFKVVQAQKRLKLMSGFFTSNLEITAFPHEELIFKLLYRV